MNKTIICSNRDEVFSRPTKRGHIRDESFIYSAIDLDAGGTWLALQGRLGRFAIVLNYHTWRYSSEPIETTKEYLSRGALPMNFIEADETLSAKQYSIQISHDKSSYRGFSLVVGDSNGTYFVSSGSLSEHTELLPGEIYCISNGGFDPWEKVIRLTEHVQKTLSMPIFDAIDKPSNDDLTTIEELELQQCRMLGHALMAPLLDGMALRDFTHGDSSAMHMRLAGVFVRPTVLPNGQVFGTRTSTVVVISPTSVALVLERDLDAPSGLWTTNELVLPFSTISPRSQS